jgi:integrase
LKTEAYLRHCERTGIYLADFFGEHFNPLDLTPHRIGEYVRARKAGKINGRAVGTNCVKQEVMILKAAMNWACGVFEGGQPLLARNPLEKHKVPREKNPRRPVIAEETIAKLLAVAGDLHPFLPVIMNLARHTGRRLSAILGLTWDDIDFDEGTIRWRAELDKKRKQWTTPIPKKSLAVLRAHRAAHPSIGATLLFPHPRNRRVPITRHLAAWWLKRAFELAKLERPDGSLWHTFRRLWATERKDLPLKDVAAAGGWSDTSTLLQCYQQPDPDTMRDVLDYERPPRRSHENQHVAISRNA